MSNEIESVKRMNFGCGLDQPKGWYNVDKRPLGQEHIWDVMNGLSVNSSTFDGIVANHSLQQIPDLSLDIALLEFLRILKPGGFLRVLVPDVIEAFDAWSRDDVDWPGFSIRKDGWGFDRTFMNYLTQGGTNAMCFTRDSLYDRLENIGFIRPLPQRIPLWLTELDSRLKESIIVTVRKPL